MEIPPPKNLRVDKRKPQVVKKHTLPLRPGRSVYSSILHLPLQLHTSNALGYDRSAVLAPAHGAAIIGLLVNRNHFPGFGFWITLTACYKHAHKNYKPWDHNYVSQRWIGKAATCTCRTNENGNCMDIYTCGERWMLDVWRGGCYVLPTALCMSKFTNKKDVLWCSWRRYTTVQKRSKPFLNGPHLWKANQQ